MRNNIFASNACGKITLPSPLPLSDFFFFFFIKKDEINIEAILRKINNESNNQELVRLILEIL